MEQVIFQAVKSENPRNASGIAGYVTTCVNCGDFIYTRFRIPILCLYCQAKKIMKDTPGKFSRFYRSGVWRRMRNVVFDLYGRICLYCGRVATHVDHKTPISRGGGNEIGNLQPVCGSCNIRKFKKTDREFKDSLQKKRGGKRG